MSAPAEDTGEEHQMTTQTVEPDEAESAFLGYADALGPDSEPEPAGADIQDAEIVEAETDASDAPPVQEPPEDPAPEPEVIQPAEIEAPTGEVMLRTDRGVLALKPDQTVLTPAQNAALVAINIDTDKDPGIIPHVRPFIHMCQVKGLDPWAKEAYLIGRGKDDKRKYTMQTGIDGYRKIANSTGRFIRVKKVLWTGQDDDDKSYRAIVDDDGEITMKRVWYDQWPAKRGYPGAAKVVIEHYDVAGNVITTDAIADWSMYAPFNPKWEWSNGKNRKVLDAKGQEVLVLNDMWEKGYAHMLAKCAEALAHRKAFPAAMSGFYVNEEMTRLNQAEQSEANEIQRTKRQQAYIDAQQRGQIATGPADPSTSWDADGADLATRATTAATVTPVAAAGEPVPAGQAVPDAVAAMRRTQDTLAEQRAATLDERAHEDAQRAPDERAESAEEAHTEPVVSAPVVSDEQRAQWFRDELAFISTEVLMQPVARLVQRVERQVRRSFLQFTVDDLSAAVMLLRAPVISRMRTNGDERAAAYAAMADGVAAPLDVLLGQDGQAAVGERDASVAHVFEVQDASGVCWCGRFSDEMIHAV